MDLPEDLVLRLDHRLATAQSSHRLPSVVAGLARADQVLWTGAAGLVEGHPPTSDTQYRIGSITKTVVAVAIMQLRDAGTLTLTDPITDHLGPAWDVAKTTLEHIRIGHLLMHTAGLAAETQGPWWERTAGSDEADLAADIAARPHPHTPGSRFHYSNVGFAILGAILSHHHDMPWDAVIGRDVLTPLGLARTTARPHQPAAPGQAVHPFADVVLAEPEHDARAMAPAGQLWSTVPDMLRWGAFLAGQVTEADVLSPETLAEMRVPGALNDTPGQAWTVAHGLGLQVFHDTGSHWVGHGGSMPGFLAAVQADPETDVCVTVATNSTAGLDRALMADVRSMVEEAFPRQPTVWQPREIPVDVRELAGTWYWGPTPLTLRITGTPEETLVLTPQGEHGRGSRFTRSGPQAPWVGQDAYYAGEVLQPVRDAEARLTHLDLASFVLTRTPYPDSDVVPGGVHPDGWGPGPSQPSG